MATREKKDKKNLVIGICCAIVVIVVVVVAIVLATSGNRLNDAYFQSDDTKYVLTLDSSQYSSGDEADEYTPVKTHLVYTYEGDNITGLKTYGEYADNAAAQAAFDAMKETGSEEIQNAVVDGKYIIITNGEESYEGMTASDIKSQIEFMENLKKMNLNSGSEGAEETEVTEE